MRWFLWLSFFLLCSARLAVGQGGVMKVGEPKARGTSSSTGDVVKAGPTGCLVEKAGTFRLRGQDFLYNLKGHEKELAGHDGDEVRVTGTIALPQGLPPTRSGRVLSVKVKTVEILHDNDPAGQAPSLGPVAGWKTILSSKYGLRFRVPKTFTEANPPYLSSAANFVSSEGVAMLGGFSIPNATYVHTNFRDGGFAVFVNPNIRSEGACSPFGDFQPKLTSLATIRGIKFAHTVIYGVAMGTASVSHNFHIYRNGLCYEFDFDFFELNGGGWDYPICAVQWIYTQNERQLTDALLSAVRFFKPRFQPVETENPRSAEPPVVTLFTQTPVPNKNARIVRFTWSTEGTDYVQIHFPLVKNIVVLGDAFYFYDQSNHNFPPSGHANLLLGNYTKASVAIQFSIEPFRAGVAYPKQSRTLTLTLKPDR